MYDFSIGFKPDNIRAWGYKDYCLVKEYKNMQDYKADKLELSSNSLLGVRIKAENVKELRMKAREFKHADYITINNPSKEVFRKALDDSLVDSVSGLELIKGYDRLHYRKTLLNQVTAKLMKEHCISLLIEFNNLKKASGLRRAIIWGRLKQNAWIAKKKGVPLMIASGAGNNSELIHSATLKALAELLGHNKNTLIIVQERIYKRAKDRKESK